MDFFSNTSTITPFVTASLDSQALKGAQRTQVIWDHGNPPKLHYFSSHDRVDFM